MKQLSMAGDALIRKGEARLPTQWGDFRVIAYAEGTTTHLALVAGEMSEPALVRVHSECLTGDVFGSLRCDCGQQLHAALQAIGAEGGALIYLRGHEGRGIGLAEKIQAYALQDGGLDTVDANIELGLPIDARDYGIAADILRELGTETVRLMTNNPHKPRSLEQHGIVVVERVAIESTPNPHNIDYLMTKRERLGHLLENI